MRILFIVALLALLPGIANAQSVKIDGVEIINYGIYSGDKVKHQEREGTAAGINTFANQKLLKQTETVPARLGIRFGVEYAVKGKPKGKTATLTLITRFPPEGLLKPNGEKFLVSQFASEKIIGDRSIRTYSLDHTWEVVPGMWTLEFWYDGKKIAEKSFRLVADGST